LFNRPALQHYSSLTRARQTINRPHRVNSTVTTEFGPDVQVTSFMRMRMRKKKWSKTAAFRLLLEVGVAESNGVVSIVGRVTDTLKLPFLRMRTKIWRKKQ